MEILIILSVLFLGSLWGLIIGIIPTAGPTTALLTSYLFIPFFYNNPYLGVVFYTAMVAACAIGDTWSSILLGIPGSSSSAATVVDGHPLAKRGRSTYALSAAFTSSTVNGLIFGSLVFAFLPYYSKIVLSFGIPELLLLNVLGLCAVIFLIKNNIMLSILSVLIGFILGYVGVDENYADRLNFGLTYLKDGISLIILISGLFAVPELLTMFRGSRKLQKIQYNFKQVKLGIAATFKYWKVSIRGGIIGLTVGMLPGVSGVVADWLSYAQSRASFPNRKFGRGNIVGVVGPEGANNSVTAGGFAPTVLFAIPGTPFAAIILSIFYLLDFNLGSIAIQTDTKFYESLFIGFVGGTLLVGFASFIISKPVTMILKIPPKIYSVIILVLITWICYQTTNTWYDVALLAVCSLLGIIAKYIGLNRPAILLAFILFPRIESLTFQSLGLFSLSDLISRPITVTLFIIAISIIVFGVRHINK